MSGLLTMMSPGMTSKPQCCNGEELDSVRKPIERRSGSQATVQIIGAEARKVCTQSRFASTWVILAQKSSFVVGSISTSAFRIADWHGSGLVNARTLLQGISASPRGKTALVHSWNKMFLAFEERPLTRADAMLAQESSACLGYYR
jgi:hypothetical protein